MEYLYSCSKCKKESTISKPMVESDRAEHCEVCDSLLTRIYILSSIKTGDNKYRK